MNVGMHGKRIKSFLLRDHETAFGQCVMVGVNCDGIHLSATFHGDRDEFWIVLTTNGEEIARHNPRYVENIVWGPE